jgi:hypothetical protein
MTKIKLALVTLVIIMLSALLLFPDKPQAQKKLYIGGSMALTGAYAENVAAVLAAFEDYAKYVNETKRMAPWRDEKFPPDITLEVLWRDDELKPAIVDCRYGSPLCCPFFQHHLAHLWKDAVKKAPNNFSPT